MDNEDQLSEEHADSGDKKVEVVATKLPSLEPQEKPGKPKKLVLVVLVIAALLISIPLLIIIFNKKDVSKIGIEVPDKPYTVVNSKQQINKSAIREMAFEISNYIKSQKRSDGYYDYASHFEDQCPGPTSSKDCPFGGINMFETTNTWGALGLYSAGKILGEKALLSGAQQDIEKLQVYCEKDRAQCNRVLAQPALIYESEMSPELLSFLNSQADALLQSPIPESPMLAAIEARSEVLLAEITSNALLLTDAKKRLDAASENLQKNTQNIFFSSRTQFRNGSCWVSLGAVVYESKTTKNFHNIGAFLENGKLVENFSEIMVPSEIQPCIESYVLLYESTGDISYLDKAKQLTQLFVQAFYDGSKSKKIYGEGGTKFVNAGEDEKSRKLVTLTDSAYTLYLLSLLYEH